MGNNDRLSQLAQRLGERLQDASHAPEELQRGVHQAMRGAFDRMELVSREDFDILMDVLQRTRARVEALETQVASLEAALVTQTSTSTTPTPSAAPTQGAASTTTPSGPPTQSTASTTPSATEDGPAPAEDAGAGEASDGPSTRG